MPTNSYGKISQPRLYVDYIQYAKMIGIIKSYYGRNNNAGPEVWNYKPHEILTYTPDDEVMDIHWDIYFKGDYQHPTTSNEDLPEGTQGAFYNVPFGKFFSTMNYYGILGTDIGYFGQDTPFGSSAEIECEIYNTGTDGTNYEWWHAHGANIVGTADVETNIGFVIKDIGDAFAGRHWINRFAVGLQLPNNFGYPMTPDASIDVGTCIAGRYFDFPRSTELSTTITQSYEGIKTKTTLSGSSITNVNYFKKPDWGDYTAWTYADTSADNFDESYMKMSSVSPTGRRSWDLTWNYIDKKDMFPNELNGNYSGLYDIETNQFDAFDGTIHKANIVGTLLNFSLGGSIPMIFQPQKDVLDFAMVKINQKSISIRQVSPELYSIKLRLTECW
jgi:hypothetical protein